MKKPYQIGAGRAVQRVRQWAEEKNPAVQLMLPMIEILALAKQGAGELVREALDRGDGEGGHGASGDNPARDEVSGEHRATTLGPAPRRHGYARRFPMLPTPLDRRR